MTSPTTSPTNRSSGSAETVDGRAALVRRQRYAGGALVGVGALHVVQGVAALAHDGVYTHVDYEYAFNLDVWGWSLLVVGLVVGGIGFGLLRNQEWARILGILVALFSALASFMLMPQSPIWQLVVIALDVMIVWAIVTVIAQDRPET